MAATTAARRRRRGRARDNVRAIDVFCGFGGSSQGIHAAGADVVAAANHNELAIQCHSANFPDTDHWRADLVDPDSGDYMDPADLPEAEFAWFSPSCTHHSQANALKLYEQGRQAMLPGFVDEEYDQAAYIRSERSRVTMSCVLRYCARRHPEIVVVENVVDVCHWGPGRDGSTFRWWLEELQKLGYEYECCFFNSMFFPPCPQSRDRVYIVAWRRGNRRPNLDYRPHAYCTSDRCGGRHVEAYQAWKVRQRSWPLERWGKHGAQYVYRCPDCHAQVDPVAWPAYTAIDWSNLGPTLDEREGLGMKPLAPTTVDRIRRGLAKFRGGPPIVIPAKSVWGVERSSVQPFGALTTQRSDGIASAGWPFLVKNNGDASEAKYRGVPVTGPMGATTTMPTQALATAGVLPVRAHAAGARVDEAIATLTTAHAGGMSLVTEGVMIPVAGNVHERPGQTRAKPLHQAGFTQHATLAFGFAHVPFITEMRGGGSKHHGQHAVTDDLHAVTAGGLHHGLASVAGAASPALFQKINGKPGDTAWHHVGDPLNTITAGGRAGIDPTGLVILPWVDQWRSDPAAVTEQLATVMTHLRHALASVEQIPLDRITDDDLRQVRFRMLEPDPELRRAMAFGDDYILIGNKTQRTAGLGNAVTPPVANWITDRCLETLGGGATNGRKKAAA